MGRRLLKMNILQPLAGKRQQNHIFWVFCSVVLTFRFSSIDLDGIAVRHEAVAECIRNEVCCSSHPVP